MTTLIYSGRKVQTAEDEGLAVTRDPDLIGTGSQKRKLTGRSLK